MLRGPIAATMARWHLMGGIGQGQSNGNHGGMRGGIHRAMVMNILSIAAYCKCNPAEPGSIHINKEGTRPEGMEQASTEALYSSMKHLLPCKALSGFA